jgi:predicted RNA-binding protein with PUA-like domain
MKAVAPMPNPVTLVAIKADSKLADMALVKLSRLSVSPVTKPQWDHICRMGAWKP